MGWSIIRGCPKSGAQQQSAPQNSSRVAEEQLERKGQLSQVSIRRIDTSLHGNEEVGSGIVRPTFVLNEKQVLPLQGAGQAEVKPNRVNGVDLIFRRDLFQMIHNDVFERHFPRFKSQPELLNRSKD